MVNTAARVLVVDDEEPVRTLVARALGPAGYEVVAATNGHDALRIVAEQGGFDLYIVDVHMPEMGGEEFSQKLRMIEPRAKVLFFSGQGDTLLEAPTAALQHEAFVDKPLSVAALREAVSVMVFGRTEPPR